MIFGLYQTFNIVRRTRDKGEFGTSVFSETTLASNVRGRFTIYNGEGNTKEEGFGGQIRWNVICEPLTVELKKGDYVVKSGIYYKIVLTWKKYDEFGVYHHHRLIIEDADG